MKLHEKLMLNLTEEEKNIKTDSYSMSVRELVSMYDDKIINLEPIYQSIYRWKEEKASKFIESLLLGIPSPSIFVSVRNGKWDVVDGVQRLSTILWFFGKLKELEGDKGDKLKLSSLEKLSSFNGLTIDDLPFEIKFEKLEIVRIDIVLLKSKNIESEYELFNRLNSGGINLSAQEIRNFLLVKFNRNLFNKLNEYKEEKSFVDTVIISPKYKDEAYDMELLIYTLILSRYRIYKDKLLEFANRFSSSRNRFIDECIGYILNEEPEMDVEYEMERISKLYNFFDANFQKPIFQKSIGKQNSKFSPTIYIVLVTFLLDNNFEMIEDIKTKIYESKIYIKNTKRGTNVVKQFIELADLGLNING